MAVSRLRPPGPALPSPALPSPAVGSFFGSSPCPFVALVLEVGFCLFYVVSPEGFNQLKINTRTASSCLLSSHLVWRMSRPGLGLLSPWTRLSRKQSKGVSEAMSGKL